MSLTRNRSASSNRMPDLDDRGTPKRVPGGEGYTTDLGSVSGKLNASATPGYTTLPSTTLRPRNRLGSFLQASFHPSRASFFAYGKVAKKLARLGWKEACKKDPSLFLGLNVVEGKVVYPGVAEAFNLPLTDPK